MIETILLSAAFSTAVSALMVFLLRTWISERLKGSIKHEYDLALESHKDALAATNNANLEILRNDLSLRAKFMEIEKGWIHEHMAKAITELNLALHDFRDVVAEHVTMFQGADYKDRARFQPVRESHQKLLKVFRERRILLPDATVDAISGFIKILADKSVEFHVEVASPHLSQEKFEKWPEIDQFVSKEGEILHRKLESDMKILLGIRMPEI